MKWITASHLNTWGHSPASETELPALVSDLIRASARTINDFRFPSGDLGKIRGLDGWLNATGVPPYVPDGESFWEFGTGQATKKKLEGDYNKRSVQFSAERRKDVSLVLVTPGHWDDPTSKLVDWLTAKRDLNDWKQVHVIEDIQLEDWLDQQPAVAARWAREFGVVPPGVRSTDQYWSEYQLRFKEPISEEVVLCGRDDAAKTLIDRLMGGPSAIVMGGDSPEEVVAFSVAAIRKADPDKREFLEARTLVVDTEEAGRSLYQRVTGVFLPNRSASLTAHLLASKGPTLKAVGADRSADDVLPRPNLYDLARAFEAIGLAPPQAHRVARECGRSMTILERTFPAEGYILAPSWREQGEKLVPALLAVAWDTARPADKAVLSEFARGAHYDDVERGLRPLLRTEDPPLEQHGTVWKVRAPVDAFLHLAQRLGPDDLERFAAVAKSVLSVIEPDPQPDDYLKFPNPDELGHSEWLRDGLATTILQIAALHGPADLRIEGQSPQAWVDALIAGIPGLKDDHRVFASLRQQLPYLMEAAPNPLLQALEHLLEGDRIAPIFEEIDGPLSPYSRHTGLLFGLETLAWDPAYLLRVCSILARLAACDPGGRLGNRPFRSLREILLPWSPNTYADDDLRFEAVLAISRSQPETGWKVALSLLPKDHDFSSPTTKPRFREAGQTDAEPMTNGRLAAFYDRLADHVVGLARANGARLADLADALDRLGGEPWRQALAEFEAYLGSAGEAARAPVWMALKALRDRHRRFADANWAIPADQLSEINALVEAFAPVTEEGDWGDLFEDWFPAIEGHPEYDEEAVLATRRKAIVHLLTQADPLERIIILADKSKLHWSVGQAAALELPDIASGVALLELALVNTGERRLEFAGALSAGLNARFPTAWPTALKDLIDKGIPAVAAARLVMAWPESNAAWDYIETLGPDVTRQYWTLKRAWRLKAEDPDLARAIVYYLLVDRPGAALDAASERLGELPGTVLLELLDRHIATLHAASDEDAFDTMSRYRLEQIFEHLDTRADMSVDDIARREYAVYPLISHAKRSMTLHKLMAANGAFFASVLGDAFPGPPQPDLTEAETAKRRNSARLAYRLLADFKIAPGLEEVGGGMDEAALLDWIQAVRSANTDPERASLYDVYIGHALAHAPADPDGGWPHAKVRDVLEQLAADDIERGIATERFNMRGAYMKSLFEGGAQERDLAARYRTWRDLARRWSRTANLLEAIAQSWDERGQDADVRARQDLMRD